MNENIFSESKKGDRVALIHLLLRKAWIVPITRIWGSGPIVVDHPTRADGEIVIGIQGEAFHTHLKGRWAAVPVVEDRSDQNVD